MNAGKSFAIDVLKAVAALLIINSHLDHLYPRSFLAADGMLGNTIFFFTTGYLLSSSLRRRQGENLPLFLWKRLIRLFPGLWIIMALLPPEPVSWGSPMGWIYALLYPTQFTFVRTILPLYPLFYLAHRVPALWKWHGLLGMCAMGTAVAVGMHVESGASTPGVAWSDLGSLTWTCHFFGAMLIGAWKAGASEAPEFPSRSRLARLSAVCAVYACLRLLALPDAIAPAGMTSDLSSILSLPCCVLICTLALDSLACLPDVGWPGQALVRPGVAFLALHSWETYLIHSGLAGTTWIQSQHFPWNVAAVFMITLTLAPLLHRVTGIVMRVLPGKTQ